MVRWKVALLVTLSLALAVAASEDHSEDPAKVVKDAMARAVEIPLQAEALVRLAWPDGEYRAEVAALAREELLNFGEHGIPALRAAITTAKSEYQADVVAMLIEARRRMTSGFPPEFLPALEEAIWFGTREARQLAIPEAARFHYRPVLLPMIDAALEDPELLPITTQALGVLGDDRARFFLKQQLYQGKGEVSTSAGVALARIGGRALEPLREALQSEDREVRLASVRALLPVAALEDLSALYEYYARYAEDDPETLKAVRDTALRLEQLLQAQQAAKSASPAPDQ